MRLAPEHQARLDAWQQAASGIRQLVLGRSDLTWRQAREAYVERLETLFPAPSGVELDAPAIVRFIDQLKTERALPIYKLTYADARQGFDALQRRQDTKAEAEVSVHVIRAASGVDVSIRVYRPIGTRSEALPGILYFHGGGWVLGGPQTHDRLIREMAVAAGAVIVFVQYALAPESQFPTQIEQGYVALTYVAAHASDHGIDGRHLGVAGDSAGGYLAAVVAQLALRRDGPRLAFQALFYPVTDASMRYSSYEEFGDGPWLTKAAMRWFWDAYAPDRRNQRSAMIAPVDEQSEILSRLPATLIIISESDVLRDEGECYARRLIAAGVEVTAVRMLGACHDFILLNPIAQTPAAKSAIRLFAMEARAAFALSAAEAQRG